MSDLNHDTRGLYHISAEKWWTSCMAADAMGFTAADAAVAKPRSGEKARCAARVGEARKQDGAEQDAIAAS